MNISATPQAQYKSFIREIDTRESRFFLYLAKQAGQKKKFLNDTPLCSTVNVQEEHHVNLTYG